ncbi:MAG TPA: YkgJ family cysteine cluster protein [Thermoplasmata archaeon]|nr:YkgJ family cysteine cluster protein [Thermoplasmata archaeon]
MEPRNPPEAPPSELDVNLLAGFTFGCRPDCGLCCFTSPRLEGDDEQRLRLAVPSVRIRNQGGARCVAAHSGGGACTLLSRLRCTAHAARPAPCREFPISVHVGTRLQASLVLSCPGVSLGPLRDFASTIPTPPLGLEAELASVRERITPAVERLRTDCTRRRRRIARQLAQQHRWMEDDEVRDRLRGRRLIPTADQYDPGELPGVEDGLERLPMFFDGRAGPVGLAHRTGGWEALELFPEGGAEPVGAAVPPDAPPSLDRAAEELLEGYLRYWVARDCFLAAIHHEMLSLAEGNVLETALAQLQSIGSDVLARASFRTRLRGEAGTRLTAREIELGIRATDLDWLDRPSWGSRL